jgi:hypothetical protein
MPVFTIMPYFGGAYGWRKTIDRVGWAGVGSNHADTHGWYATPSISDDLQQQFASWQSEFESIGWKDEAEIAQFDWVRYHHLGILLSHRLKDELGEQAIILYEKAYEDPCHHDAERREILTGGLVRILLSRKRQVQIAAKEIVNVQP